MPRRSSLPLSLFEALLHRAEHLRFQRRFSDFRATAPNPIRMHASPIIRKSCGLCSWRGEAVGLTRHLTSVHGVTDVSAFLAPRPVKVPAEPKASHGLPAGRQILHPNDIRCPLCGQAVAKTAFELHLQRHHRSALVQPTVALRKALNACGVKPPKHSPQLRKSTCKIAPRRGTKRFTPRRVKIVQGGAVRSR